MGQRGRPKGYPKTGGRKKGTPNKRTQILEQKAAEGITPLDFLLSVLRNEELPVEIRLDAAKAAAPFIHPRRAPEDRAGKTVPPIFYIHPSLEADGSDLTVRRWS